MSLACGLALILDNARRSSRSRVRFVELFDGENGRNWLFGLLFLVGLAGLLASFSRAGITFGLLALLLTMLASGRFARVRARLAVALLVLAAAVVPLVQIGSEKLVERYSSTAEDFVAPGGRAVVWGNTLAMAAAHPVSGTGFGTFAVAYPLYRSPEVRLFYAHAHNDVLQALAEGGIVGLPLWIAVLAPILYVALRCVAGAKGPLAVGLAAGLTAIVLHSLVDFNLHIPADAATAVALAGALLGLPWTNQASS
jgi:O-antigen ligase